MPHQTFFSLEEEKQQRILEAALHEFSEKAFPRVTVDNIVKGADIPKGSFYQYFSDKHDLYKHLFCSITEEKKDSLKSFLTKREEMSFASFIRSFYLFGAQYDLRDPKTLDLQDKFMRNCRKELRDEILELMTEESNSLFREVIGFYQNKGELKPDLDIGMTAEIMTTLTIFLSKRLMASAETSMNEVGKAVDDMLNIVLTGIIKEAV